MSLYAHTFGFAAYADSAHKLLSANRDFYLRMSAMTRNGRVPTADEVRASFNPHRQDEAAAARGALADGDFLYGGVGVEMARAGGNRVGIADSGQMNAAKRHSRSSALHASTHSPLTDEQPRRAASPISGTYDPDPPTPEEVAEAYQFSYGA